MKDSRRWPCPKISTIRRGPRAWPTMLMGLVGLILVAAACAPTAATPTATPVAPTTAPAAKPTEKPAEKTSAPTASPAVKPTEKPTTVGGQSRVPQAIIDGANKEGQLRLYWTTTATDQWRQRFQDALNEMYGTKISITDTRGGDWARDTAKIISETAAGQKPSYDIMITTEAHHSDLFHAGLLGQFNWTEVFGVPAQAVMFKGGAFSFAHQIALPAYNTNLVKPEDVPKRWEDLLDPRWKEKIGVSTATHHWARLSQTWGDEKTTDFVQRLAAQSPRLGPPQDVTQRLQLGEIYLAATQLDNHLRTAQKRGAPIAWAEEVQPVLIQSLTLGPIKGGPNPNAAILFAGLLASKRGQALWLEFQEQSSIFVEGSPYWKFVQGKQYILLREDFMEKELEARTTKYGRMLGFR